MTTFTSVTDAVDYVKAADINQYGTLFQAIPGPDGWLENGVLSVTVASSNITVALKTKAGANPSASDPVTVWINGTKRQCTAALSVTKNAGTNWFGSGSTPLATKEVDYFVYLLWNTTPGTDIIDIGFARIPFGRVYSDFSSTTTNEKYLAFANASTPTSTDDCVNVGRFAATLSATAAFTWSVPTFTNLNLIQAPCNETRWLSYLPTYGGTGSLTFGTVTTTMAVYKIVGDEIAVALDVSGTTGGVTSYAITISAPLLKNVTKQPGLTYVPAYIVDTATQAGYLRYATSDYDGIEAELATEGNWALAAGRYVRGTIRYAI